MEPREPEFAGRPVSEIQEILKYFEWNWHLAADHLGCDSGELKSAFSRYQPNPAAVLDTPNLYTAGKISRESITKLQEFTNQYLKDPLPILLDDEISDARKSEIATGILLSFGLPYKLLHADEFKETYAQLEDEALSLERWREQDLYLTLIEEMLFRLSVQLEREEKAEREKSADDFDLSESESD